VEERIALFDLNGTILDDTGIWFDSVRETFTHYGKEPPTLYDYIRGFSGDYLRRYRDLGIQAPREEINGIYERYYETHMNQINLSRGAYHTLKTLIGNGVFTGLVTAQTKKLAVPLLKRFGLYRMFHCRVYDVLDKARLIREICENEEIAPKNCFYLGDSPPDVTAAKKAGAKAVSLLDSGMPEDLVTAREPDFTVRDVREFLKFFGLERFGDIK